MTLTLTIGAAAPAFLRQSASILNNTSILPVASTAGTCLLAVVANITGVTGSTPTGAASGFTRLLTADQGGVAHIELWAYPNNPGGINTANFGTSMLHNSLSEWSGLSLSAASESSGTATATAGTSLSLATSASLALAQDVAITAWVQNIAVAGAVTFTTPSGFTLLTDDSVQVTHTYHMAIAYQINPSGGVPLPALWTSGTATTSAAGFLAALKAAPQAVDMAPYLAY